MHGPLNVKFKNHSTRDARSLHTPVLILPIADVPPPPRPATCSVHLTTLDLTKPHIPSPQSPPPVRMLLTMQPVASSWHFQQSPQQTMHKHHTVLGTTWNTKIRTIDVTETPHLMSTTQVLFLGYVTQRSALTQKRNSKLYVRILVKIKVQAFPSTA